MKLVSDTRRLKYIMGSEGTMYAARCERILWERLAFTASRGERVSDAAKEAGRRRAARGPRECGAGPDMECRRFDAWDVALIRHVAREASSRCPCPHPRCGWGERMVCRCRCGWRRKRHAREPAAPWRVGRRRRV